MASEQERKEAFLKVWFDAPENIHWAHGMSNGVEKDISDTFDRAIAAWNTRPAPTATDTGLKTIGFVPPMFVEGKGADYNDIFRSVSIAENYTAVVTSSQAVELLAAERAKVRHWQEQYTEMHSQFLDLAKSAEADNAAKVEQERLRFEGDLDKWMKIIGAGITGYQPEAYALMDLACEELVKLRADNAALTARVKELDEDRDHQSNLSNKLNRSHAALEAKLAAAEKAARAAHETLIEINPSNYNHDDVCQLNDASVEAIFLLADILGETHGKTKEWWDERRAVLGGKPS